MATDSNVDTSRTVVQVYVPTYQRDEWDEHANRLDMSRSEFVKTMVQAGRRGFGADPEAEQSATRGGDTARSGPPEDEAQLRNRIVESLENADALSWDELLAAVTDDVESRLERALEELQNEGIVHHSGREGGYVLDSSEER